MDRTLTNEEKLEFMKKVLNGNLSEIEKTLFNIKNNSNVVTIREEEITPVKEVSNDIDVASIYAKEALPFVKEDLESHPVTSNQEVVNDIEEPSEIKEGPVLKRTLSTESKVPNPWGESGAKLVSPGEKLDY